ncbi:MAG: protein kinase [Armatimonadetes bacterium]|nr:protein kinase [Armatimonadota bacterium]
MTGTVLKHRYEVQEKIGDGSLFTVYRADDKIDSRTVAVKALLAQHASNRMFAERMLVEAQAMVGLSHPGIAAVYDCGEEDGSYFVVTEYVEGVDLKERIHRSAPFTLATAVDFGIAICDALDFAHRRGFVHGDLRPRNIIVTPEGYVKLTDFWVGSAVSASQSVRTTAMMRSVHYMAPEVAEGVAATAQSDLYSLGIIMYELLTGNVPYDADTPIAIAIKHGRDPIPSIRAGNPGVPKAFEALITRALQKEPGGRFRSAKAMLNDLRSVREGLDLPGTTTWSPPTKTRMLEPILEDDPEMDDSEPAVLSMILRTLAITVTIIGVIAAAVIAFVWMNPGETQVPEIVGKDITTARQMAAESKVRLLVKAEEFNEKYAEGFVYFSNPAPGRTIKAGKTVDVWVSRGSKYARVPRLTTLPEETARKRLMDANLTAGNVTQEYSDSVEAGNVIKQSSEPGTRLMRNDPVDLVISLGPKPTEEDFSLSEDTSSGGSTEIPAKPRYFDVAFQVPSGRENQMIQITVVDDYGENVVYSEIAHPGDVIEQTVPGIGKKVSIRIYIDDKLIKELKK